MRPIDGPLSAVCGRGAGMPRKRAIETRIAEMEDKMDKLKLEKSIKDLREKMRIRAPRRRRRR